MEVLRIDPKKDSPGILCDPEQGRVEINGESYPENAAKFYTPVFAWIEAYLQAARPLAVDLRLTYLNSSSSKIVLNLLDLLENAVGRGIQVEVRWFYHVDNQTLLDCGEEFAEDCGDLPFHLVPLCDPVPGAMDSAGAGE